MSNTNPTEKTRRQRREQAATDALRALIRDILLDTFPLLEGEDLELPLTLSLKLGGHELNELTFEHDLRAQVVEQAEAFLKPRETFVPGAVYDFHDHRSQRPPDALAVFAGYDPVGHPKWSQVYEILAKEEPLKIFSGKELKTEQLQDYGKNDKAYNLLGQCITGPLPVPKAYEKLTQSSEWALSIQIVETRDTKTHFALHLNLLVGGLLPEELDAMIQELPLRHVNTAVLELQEKVYRLEELARQAWDHQDQQAFTKHLKNVPQLLRRFSKQLFA